MEFSEKEEQNYRLGAIPTIENPKLWLFLNKILIFKNPLFKGYFEKNPTQNPIWKIQPQDIYIIGIQIDLNMEALSMQKYTFIKILQSYTQTLVLWILV